MYRLRVSMLSSLYVFYKLLEHTLPIRGEFPQERKHCSLCKLSNRGDSFRRYG